ncbi:MAG: hypothetical protein Q9222_000334 [Ikaeria aurantiellina]
MEFIGCRLRDYHVSKVFCAVGGGDPFPLLASLFNETFTRVGIKLDRPGCGQPAVVKTPTGQWKFGTLGNIVPHGDVDTPTIDLIGWGLLQKRQKKETAGKQTKKQKLAIAEDDQGSSKSPSVTTSSVEEKLEPGQ